MTSIPYAIWVSQCHHSRAALDVYSLTFNAPLFEGISESEALGSVAPQLTRAMSRVTGILVTDPIHSPFESCVLLPQEPDTDIVFLFNIRCDNGQRCNGQDESDQGCVVSGGPLDGMQIHDLSAIVGEIRNDCTICRL